MQNLMGNDNYDSSVGRFNKLLSVIIYKLTVLEVVKLNKRTMYISTSCQI